MDIKGFLERTGKKQRELSLNLGVSQPTISSWAKGKRPSFEVIDKMLKLGFTIEEIFGKETANANANSELQAKKRIFETIPPAFDTPEFRAGVAQAVKDMKERGLL